jgi:hypothetical protein
MGLTLRYEQKRSMRQVVAAQGVRTVGRLRWHAGTGIVYGAWVRPELQRQGIGVSMWEFANSDAVPEAERPRRPLEPEVRNAAGDALYWAGRRRREARERGETP